MKFDSVQRISEQVHSEKYRLQGEDFEAAMARVAHAMATDHDHGMKLYGILKNRRFLPGGRIQLAMGSGRSSTAFNCYVSRTIEDSVESIMTAASEAAQTLRLGGGIGYNFSHIRPKGSIIRTLGSKASGPISFMGIFNATAATISSAGNRRGAQMGVLRVDHPDIEEFIYAKNNSEALNCFNVSVAVTNEFMEGTGKFDLVHGSRVYDRVDREALMEAIMRSTWDWAEPGVLFIDRINRMNNLKHYETIEATNPCGEQPLPPYGACLLGSFNLVAYFNEGIGGIDYEQLEQDIPVVVEAMDNVIDRTNYPLNEQANEARMKRRMGLGITGFANASELAGFPYGSDFSKFMLSNVCKFIANKAYRASASLALRRGSFGLMRNNDKTKDKYLSTPFIQKLDRETQEAIERFGIRNSHLTSIAPTGTISITADNISSGIEPPYMLEYERAIILEDGPTVETVYDHAYLRYGIKGVTAMEVSARRHVEMLAAAQEWVDSAVSKTVNVGSDVTWDEFVDLYKYAYELGCKGLTTFRPDGKRMGVLREKKEDKPKACEYNPVTGERSCE